ncbi:uncharacterized protein CMU_034190 [Cryptosporidium muris RN66]|uniref:GOLD domain-containing protein n=1 Tax=Cryptosporidium muris (strain RN66) TaxID=441375 RepID=B6AFP2_CRYMR|nr:uncharacterized protein CMU_034190 [Cryptosporidium muris RN66]EEA07033.1 hypothetical protein, conserved [Cryptosporidium muris RN66]|eukprot:XP_002141382.1 hypothetical protein [Cryptosporidium muris RN66]
MIFISFLLTYIIIQVNGVYFYVSEGTEKCFEENTPNNTPITVNYNSKNNIGVQCAIVFKDPDNHEVYSKPVDSKESDGKAAYMTQNDGEHKICIRCESSNWFSTELIRWEMSIIKEGIIENIDISLIADRDQLDNVDLTIQRITRRINILLAESEYEHHQQDEFLYNTLSMNSRITLFSVLQIVLSIMTTGCYLIYLKRFFKRQKFI